MSLPNFVILGAAKSGTTALYQYLNQHPEIYMSRVKETNFFALEGKELNFIGPGDPINFRSVTNILDYEALFARAGQAKAVGEASPLYLYSPDAPLNIQHYTPSMKMIAVLRDPARRAYATYLFLRRENREQEKEFQKALSLEQERIDAGWEYIWHYTQLGFYYQQLKRYYDIFPTRQIRVYLYNDFENDPMGVMKNIYEFLEVDNTYQADMSYRPHFSGIPKSRFIQHVIMRPNILMTISKFFLPKNIRRKLQSSIQKRNLVRPDLPQNIHAQLIDIFRDDILQLQELIQRDLSQWLTA